MIFAKIYVLLIFSYYDTGVTKTKADLWKKTHLKNI